MIQVQVNPSLKSFSGIRVLKKAAQVVLDYCQQGPGSDLSILVTDDEQVHNLNHEYRNIDETTDVLSFSSMEKDPDTNHVYLGDVIISFDKALKQADQAGHPVLVELQLLVVHGVLHLLGYDHVESYQKSRMWDTQNKILALLDIHDINIVTESD